MLSGGSQFVRDGILSMAHGRSALWGRIRDLHHEPRLENQAPNAWPLLNIISPASLKRCMTPSIHFQIGAPPTNTHVHIPLRDLA